MLRLCVDYFYKDLHMSFQKNSLHAIALAALLASASAQAGVVKLWGESYPLSRLNDFYNSLSGVTSSTARSTVMPVAAYQAGSLNSPSLFGSAPASSSRRTGSMPTLRTA